MNLSVLEPRIKFTPAAPRTISSVLIAIKDFEEKRPSTFKLNLRPKYQRGEAWEQSFKEMLIYSIITNYPIGNFLFRSLNNNSTELPTHEVVDGQQRLLAIKQFVDKDWKLSPNISRHIVEENIDSFIYDVENNMNPPAIKIYDKFKKDNTSNIKLGFIDLPSTIQQRILNHPLNTVDIIECTEESVSQFFRFIQNQERLRAGEIINAIPDSKISEYLDLVTSKEAFLEKINWKESRKEFEKIFYSMAGIFDNKLNFGTTDDSIIDYVANFTGLSENGDYLFRRMIDNVNAIIKCNITNKEKFSKRLIKFIFLTAGYGVVDFTKETDKYFDLMIQIENKMPCFNSGQQNKIKKVFGNYDDEIIKKYNQLFILGRGSHSSKSTRETILNYIDIINYELGR